MVAVVFCGDLDPLAAVNHFQLSDGMHEQQPGRVLGDGFFYAEVLFTVRIVLQLNVATDSSIAHHWLTGPLLDSDRLDGHRWSTISVMITIAKVHFRETATASFESPVGRKTRGSLPGLRTSLTSNWLRIVIVEF
jgi:hypothetical protein